MENLCPLINATLCDSLVETLVTGVEGANEDTLRLEHLELLAQDFCACRKSVVLHVLNIISQLVCIVMERKNRNIHLKHVTQVVRDVYFMQNTLFAGFAVVTNESAYYNTFCIDH